jgi:alpha-tubulin suppressor-like RCC1 family protein
VPDAASTDGGPLDSTVPDAGGDGGVDGGGTGSLHATRIYVSNRNTFALMSDGTLYTWSNGIHPAVVPGVTSVRAFATAENLSCAVTADGHLWCEGQCGFFPTDSTSCSSAFPTTFTDWGPFSAADVATGGSNGFFVQADGTLRGWGDGSQAELGTGATGHVGAPIAIAGVPTVTEVVTGAFASCAIAPGGTVYCWGRNDRGNLGGGTTGGMSAMPVHVPIDDALDLAYGYTHVCARRAVNEIWCWGSDDFGELGDGGALAQSSTPVRAAGLPSDVVLPSTLSESSTCVIRRSDGHVLCWGYGAMGSLGDGRGVTSATPVEVTGLSGVIDLAGGGTYWCALTAAHQVFCWGQQIGIAMTLAPSPVIGLPS